MSEARLFSCPGCGAPVAQGDRNCTYCQVPVATVRCGRCFAMNSPDAAHCFGCGAALGLMPMGERDILDCPDCGISLSGFGGGSGHLRDCERCGGQFVDHALLHDLIERREVYGQAAPRVFARPPRTLEPVRYRKCPSCGTMMNRKNFGHSSGVIVDQCSRHGTWFHAGELPRVLEFVETGGLARARQREVEEAERRKREALAATDSTRLRAALQAPPELSRGDHLIDAVSALLDLVFSHKKH